MGGIGVLCKVDRGMSGLPGLGIEVMVMVETAACALGWGRVTTHHQALSLNCGWQAYVCMHSFNSD